MSNKRFRPPPKQPPGSGLDTAKQEGIKPVKKFANGGMVRRGYGKARGA